MNSCYDNQIGAFYSIAYCVKAYANVSVKCKHYTYNVDHQKNLPKPYRNASISISIYNNITNNRVFTLFDEGFN